MIEFSSLDDAKQKAKETRKRLCCVVCGKKLVVWPGGRVIDVTDSKTLQKNYGFEEVSG